MFNCKFGKKSNDVYCKITYNQNALLFSIHNSSPTVIDPRVPNSVAFAVNGATYSARCIHRVGQARAGNMVFLCVHCIALHCQMLHHVQKMNKLLEPIFECSSGTRWLAYLRRSLSEWMTMQKRFYASMRLPTFTKVLQFSIYNFILKTF